MLRQKSNELLQDQSQLVSSVDVLSLSRTEWRILLVALVCLCCGLFRQQKNRESVAHIASFKKQK